MVSVMTKPMNIAMNNMDNYCDEKCGYSFQYLTSNICTATNYGTYLHLNYLNAGTTAPVNFNSNAYNVDNIEIYCPSLHEFNGGKTDAEMIITHMPTSVGQPLIVCIPLSAAGKQSNTATQIVSDIINTAVMQPLKEGDPAMAIKLNDYSLNKIIPLQPFYFYNDSNNYNIIVFGIENAISVNPSVISGLQTLIQGVTDVKYPSVEFLEYNKYGPTIGNGSDNGEIYINCQPTGNSEEEIPVTYDKQEMNNDLGSLFSNPTFILIISSLIFVCIIFAINKLLVFLVSKDTPKSFSEVFGKK